MGFWRWYLGGLVKVPSFLISFLISGYGQYVWGITLGAASSVVLAAMASPYWLLLTLPATVTICAHGLWRERR